MQKWLVTVSVIVKGDGTEKLVFVFEAASVQGCFDLDDELAAKNFLIKIGVNVLRVEKVDPMP